MRIFTLTGPEDLCQELTDHLHTRYGCGRTSLQDGADHLATQMLAINGRLNFNELAHTVRSACNHAFGEEFWPQQLIKTIEYVISVPWLEMSDFVVSDVHRPEDANVLRHRFGTSLTTVLIRQEGYTFGFATTDFDITLDGIEPDLLGAFDHALETRHAQAA